MSVSHDTVASYDATAKLKVDSTNTSKPQRRSFLSVIYALSRSLAGDVCLWESEILAKVSRRHDVPLTPLKTSSYFSSVVTSVVERSWNRDRAAFGFQHCRDAYIVHPVRKVA